MKNTKRRHTLIHILLLSGMYSSMFEKRIQTARVSSSSINGMNLTKLNYFGKNNVSKDDDMKVCIQVYQSTSSMFLTFFEHQKMMKKVG